MATARDQLSQRASGMRPYEQVEWTNAEQEAWLLMQAYEGMLRAVETSPKPQRQVLLGKTAAARLAGRLSAPTDPHHGRRHVRPALPLWLLVRGCPGAGISPAPVEPRV